MPHGAPDLDQAASVGASHFVPIVRYLSLSLDIDLNSRFALKEQRGGLGPGAAEKLALISSGSRGHRQVLCCPGQDCEQSALVIWDCVQSVLKVWDCVKSTLVHWDCVQSSIVSHCTGIVYEMLQSSEVVYIMAQE